VWAGPQLAVCAVYVGGRCPRGCQLACLPRSKLTSLARYVDDLTADCITDGRRSDWKDDDWSLNVS
jgi:hypothetical protein